MHSVSLFISSHFLDFQNLLPFSKTFLCLQSFQNLFLKISFALSGLFFKSLDTTNCRTEWLYPTILKLIDKMRSFPRERASGILVDFIRVGALLSFAMQRTCLFSCSRSMAEYFSPTTIKCLFIFLKRFPFKRNYISSDFSISPRRYVGPKLNALPSLF